AEASGRRDGPGEQTRGEDANLLHDGRVRPRQRDGGAERRCRDAGPPRARKTREHSHEDPQGVEPRGSHQGRLETPVRMRSAEDPDIPSTSESHTVLDPHGEATRSYPTTMTPTI